MRIVKVVAVFMLVVFSSCNQKQVYNKFEKNFPENRWQKTDIRKYEFEIVQGATQYDMEVHFAHIYGYQFATIPLKITIENPDNTRIYKNINLQITDNEGIDLGDCAGDICDLKALVFENESLPVGKYKVSVSHDFQGEYLPNILGFGIEVSANFD